MIARINAAHPIIDVESNTFGENNTKASRATHAIMRLIEPLLIDKGKDCDFEITLKITPISQQELKNLDISDDNAKLEFLDVCEDNEEVTTKNKNIIFIPQEEEIKIPHIPQDEIEYLDISEDDIVQLTYVPYLRFR